MDSLFEISAFLPQAPEIFTRKRNPKPSQKLKSERAAAAAAAGGEGSDAAAAAAGALTAPPPAKRARKAASSPKPKASSSKKAAASAPLPAPDSLTGALGPAEGGNVGLPQLASPPRPMLSALYPGQAFNQYGQPVYLPNGTGQNVGPDGPPFFSALFNNPGQPSFDPPGRSQQQQQQQPQSLQLAQLHSDGANGIHTSHFPSSSPYPPYQMHSGALSSHLYGVNPPAGQLYSGGGGGGGYPHPMQQQMPSSSHQLPQLHLNPLSSSSQGSRSPAGFPYQSPAAAAAQGALVSPQQPFQQGFPSPDQSNQLPPSHQFAAPGESASGLNGLNGGQPSNGGGQQTLSGPHSRGVYASYEANHFRPPSLPQHHQQQHFPPHNLLPGSHFPSLPYMSSFADHGHGSSVPYLPEYGGGSGGGGGDSNGGPQRTIGDSGNGGQQEPLQHHLSGHSTQSSSSASTPQQQFENPKAWPPPPPLGLQQPATALHSEVLRQRSPLIKPESSLASPSIRPPKAAGEVGVPVTVANSA